MFRGQLSVLLRLINIRPKEPAPILYTRPRTKRDYLYNNQSLLFHSLPLALEHWIRVSDREAVFGAMDERNVYPTLIFFRKIISQNVTNLLHRTFYSYFNSKRFYKKTFFSLEGHLLCIIILFFMYNAIYNRFVKHVSKTITFYTFIF